MIKLRFGFTSLPLSDQRTWGKVVYLDNYRNKSKVLVLSMSKVMDSDKTHMTIIKAMSLDILYSHTVLYVKLKKLSKYTSLVHSS